MDRRRGEIYSREVFELDPAFPGGILGYEGVMNTHSRRSESRHDPGSQNDPLEAGKRSMAGSAEESVRKTNSKKRVVNTRLATDPSFVEARDPRSKRHQVLDVFIGTIRDHKDF